MRATTRKAEPPELLAFGADHVCRLTGLSKRRLGYWDKTKFFAPQYAEENRRRPFSRIYSFRDVVGLRTVAVLRNTHGVPLQELRKVGAWLKKHHATPWASLTLYVSAKRVYFDDPRTGLRMEARPGGRAVLPFAMEEVANEMRGAAERLRRRTRDDEGRVVQNRYLVHNAPVLAGTRIPTTAVRHLREAGYTTAAIIREYPRLKPKDVRAALRYEKERRARAG
jgi:uncharacterized protein (DUF433 family)